MLDRHWFFLPNGCAWSHWLSLQEWLAEYRLLPDRLSAQQLAGIVLRIILVCNRE
jgi:hypothetical protein